MLGPFVEERRNEHDEDNEEHEEEKMEEDGGETKVIQRNLNSSFLWFMCFFAFFLHI